MHESRENLYDEQIYNFTSFLKVKQEFRRVSYSNEMLVLCHVGKEALMSLVTAISASGNTVPPLFVFPRKSYKDYFFNKGLPDCIDVGNESGWVKNIEFKK